MANSQTRTFGSSVISVGRNLAVRAIISGPDLACNPGRGTPGRGVAVPIVIAILKIITSVMMCTPPGLITLGRGLAIVSPLAIPMMCGNPPGRITPG